MTCRSFASACESLRSPSNRTDVCRLEAAAACAPRNGEHYAVNGVEREQLALELRRQRGAFADSEEMGEARQRIRRVEHRQFAERVGIARRAELVRGHGLLDVN